MSDVLPTPAPPPAVLRWFNAHGLRKKASFAGNLARLLRHRARARLAGRPLVAIALTEHFGDIVACEPVARYVRQRHPQARIVWVTRAPYRELVAHHPSLDGCLAVFCLTEWIWLSRLGLFDTIYDLHMPDRICRYCKIPLRKPPALPVVNGRNYLRLGGLLAAFSQGAGLPALADAPRVHIPPAAAARVARLNLPGRYAVVHGTANDYTKHWPPAKWAALIAAMQQEQRLAVVEVGLTPFVQPAPPGLIDLCGRLSLLETAEVIRRAAVFIGIDSGPAHLANAVGTRGVLLLGAYSYFDRYNPFSGDYAAGRRCVLLQADGPAAKLPVEAVFAAVGRVLND